MSNTLATTESVIVPKPTKREVVAALVEVARKEHAEKRALLDKEKRETKEAARRAVAEWLAKHPETVRALISGAQLSLYYSEVEFRVPDTAPAYVRTLLDKAKAKDDERLGDFNAKIIAQQIEAKITNQPQGADRIAALVKSPEIAALWKQLNA